jgi:hypothetical protein
MICLGDQGIEPEALEYQAAQQWAVHLFSLDFKRRYPGGLVLSELEYMGRTTAAPNDPGPLLFRGNGALSRITRALSSDFRNWVRDRDYRKCDALGLSWDGHHAELLEVTTGRNVLSASGQLLAKLAILRGTVERIHDLRTDWLPSLWRGPVGSQAFLPLPSRTVTALRYVCYFPTYRYAAPPGVVLYEIHELRRNLGPQPVPVPIPDRFKDALRDALRRHNRKRLTWSADPEEAAAYEEGVRQLLNDHPWMKDVLKLMAVAGVIALVPELLPALTPAEEAEGAAFVSTLARLAVATP